MKLFKTFKQIQTDSKKDIWPLHILLYFDVCPDSNMARVCRQVLTTKNN